MYFWVGSILSAPDCGTVQPGDVPRKDENDTLMIFLIYFPLFLQAVGAIVFIGTRFSSMAIQAIALAWLPPVLYVAIGGPNIAVLFFITLPSIMVLHIPFWRYGDEHKNKYNPLATRPYEGPIV
jgi:hypothetical protein